MATIQEVAIDVAHKLNLWEANYYGIFHLGIDGGTKCPYIDLPLLIFLLEKGRIMEYIHVAGFHVYGSLIPTKLTSNFMKQYCCQNVC